ncbi:MAG: glycosyltransferase family 1 protein [Woeseiaceae bacterium]|nr:glycosyltransferase family 1 protein [Woeseiaceae bacterium]
MRIAIATDAWRPQVNGVVTTLGHIRDELERMGHEVLMITPEGRRSVPCPTYPEIRLAFFQRRRIARELAAFRPDCIHIATEGPLGLATRACCRRLKVPFTTSYHTRFAEYVRARAPIPLAWSYAFLRWFHGGAERTLVPTAAVKKELGQRRVRNVCLWTRGVDTRVFNAENRIHYDLPRPIWINVGRVSVEKNIAAFLALDLPGSKVIVGDGPDREKLEQQYPDCYFAGYRFGADLAAHLAGADVFVFPSLTDTFGLVMLEAMACGLPVAAFPVTGPIDVVQQGITGVMRDDLAQACRSALFVKPATCRRYAETRSWRSSAEEFLEQLSPTREAVADRGSVGRAYP